MWSWVWTDKRKQWDGNIGEFVKLLGETRTTYNVKLNVPIKNCKFQTGRRASSYLQGIML